MPSSFVFPTFRDLARKVMPPWLQVGNAQKIFYAMTIQLDALVEALPASIKIRYPNLYSAESLPLIGRQRRIRRGPNESAESYGKRLRRWLDDHPRRGGPYALLEQLRAYFLPLKFPMHLIYRSGARYVMNEDGAVARDVITTEHFDQWARWWLLLYSDDLEATDAELAAVPQEWIAAHMLGEVLVMRHDSVLWDYPPEEVWDDPNRVWDEPDNVQRVAIGTAEDVNT